MRKRVWMAAAVAAASLVILNGCLADTYPLTEEEQNIIAEYAAGVLLRSDSSYTQALISPTPTPSPTPAPSPTPEPTTAPGDKGNSGSGKGDKDKVEENATLEDVYGLAGLSVTYDGFEVLDKVEETGGYVVPYEKGKKVVKINFTLKNTAGIEQTFDFSKHSINYQLDCKEKNFIPPMITALAGDMLYMETTLSAGESCEGFVLFRIPEKAEENLRNVIISRDSYTSIVALKK